MSETTTDQNKSLKILDIIVIFVAIAGFSILTYSVFDPHHENFHLLLLIGTLLILASSYFVYKILEKTTSNKQYSGSLWLSFVVGITMFTLAQTFTPLLNLEEDSVSSRFLILRGSKTVQEFENESGRIELRKFDPPPKARHDIQIIGITTNSLEKLEGTWPLPWNYYADIIEKFTGSSNTLMFDIFFLDYKKGETEAMASAMKKNQNVLFDYPMETSAESKESVKNLESRIEILRKFRLKNVIDESRYNYDWVKFPQPPIEPVAELSSGLGFANVKKDEAGMNRKMPLVVKVPNSGPNREPEYYPSIDLLLATNYYGVDIQRDVYVKMGESITIKNIPDKKLTSFNRRIAKMETKDIMAIPNENREIVIPIDWEGQMEINFVGGRYSFNSHEIFEVATEWEEETAQQFSNNIFLVAMYYATGRGASKDAHLSPFGDMSGIEHHAQALNTILNQDFLFNTSKLIDFITYLALAVLIGFLQPRVSTLYGFGISVLMLVLYSILSMYLFAEHNLITILPTVLLEQVFIFISIIGFRILTEEANVKYIRSTFSKFVSKDVVDELLKNPDNLALGGSKREITIFFSDIRGFTTISEALGPEELVQLLNEYLSAMTEIIIEYKGTIDKYMGDAIMAFWGAPVPLEDHAYYSCIAALAQMDYLDRILKPSWIARKVPVIDIGIGLNSGPAVVGNMGSSHRMEYTCMGDTINLGSRLEGSNKMYGTNIIISEYTYEKVKDKVIARELDLVKVKGKTQPVRIYELLGISNPEDMEKMKRPLSKLGAS
ncbi:adenylate/guanylate cyclase domain-containing protein [Leptospira sp. GIMC2001]|uniref:adenylate/guanylate cyclase domain-containing protein n=1 Tax=Leptospira sp. GIMC2001 TaxID=1513297 RepID=UPI0023490F77|nr:adenylate/guanylate cyclase domain-containing protein [Leptospira sp. GIMC2001]WCL48726.1 adenylate/guanylate cyclase domain-containing protein [Leptospira sp. GIMC2001]